MPDLGHDLQFGVFLTPVTDPPDGPVELARVADHAGLDLVAFQDHPYQPAFADTWTLLSYVAAVTHRIDLVPDVANLPLRNPAVLARSAASLDRLSGGRVELGLGAGAFWDAIVAMGGRRLSAGESVQALEEAIAIIRGIWAADERGRLVVDGDHHRVDGAKRGPAPAHDMGIWVGAYGPRMLELIGRLADGWLPSLGYLSDGPAALRDMSRRIDEGAASAGRDPGDVRRLLNIEGRFGPRAEGVLQGPPERWAEDLVDMALEHGISGFILQTDEAETIERFAGEVAPAVRQQVAAERG
ncbi:LLM class flavin-dependent oxidoreductase [Euzebya sp.]|uniref:LLM class flavin-dependent oxidoreductase n=1 Tax=Euzebya sp. TaxID=1971409 RepID=UPI003518734C